MTKLLVSVRDATEARTAISAGADLIDVKEPHHGSLGAASMDAVADVAQVVVGRAPLSVACGELLELHEQAGISFQQVNTRIDYAKLGLAGCGLLPDWPVRLQQAIQHWSTSITSVAVVYADWQLCNAPSPEAVLLHACSLGCGAILIDTYDKSAGNLLAHFTVEQLGSLNRQARSQGLAFVLAGSLDTEAIESVVPIQPDYVAVRGAVCRGRREGALDGDLVSALKSKINKFASRSRSEAALSARL